MSLEDKVQNRKGFNPLNNWVLLGAIALGIVIVLYLVFFCPEECH